MGPDHTVCLTEHGKAVTMGRNIEAQLGKGHTHSGGGKPYLVKAMAEKEITLISAGATFTVVGTTENVLYFWGTRHIRYHKIYWDGTSSYCSRYCWCQIVVTPGLVPQRWWAQKS